MMKHLKILFALMMLTSCKLECSEDGVAICAPGTSTGNPMQIGVPTNGAPIDNSQPHSARLRDLSCRKIIECRPDADLVSCQEAIDAADDIGELLGLDADHSPFSAIIEAESRGVISANLPGVRVCGESIANLSCSSAEAAGAYRPMEPAPFAEVSLLFSDLSCRGVFGP